MAKTTRVQLLKAHPLFPGNNVGERLGLTPQMLAKAKKVPGLIRELGDAPEGGAGGKGNPKKTYEGQTIEPAKKEKAAAKPQPPKRDDDDDVKTAPTRSHEPGETR